METNKQDGNGLSIESSFATISSSRSFNFSSRNLDAMKDLEFTIAEILPSNEPLDSPNFSPIEYINTMFPNEHSLVDIDGAISNIKSTITRTDEEIIEEVRMQLNSGTKSKEDLASAQKEMGELFTKLKQIKSKADQSEKMVAEISRDIKSLDFGKKNLTTAITAIKRLQMLITAVDQLKKMASRKQYREAGSLLEAINVLSEHFTEYRLVPKINEQNKSIHEIKSELIKNIYSEFSLFQDNPLLVPLSQLSDACVVIDALGKDSKRDFMIWYCNKELQEYNRFFQPGEVSGSLENTDRRFAWLKKTLLIFDDQHSKIFPKVWNMDEMICEEFCFTTRQHLIDILEATRKSLNADDLVAALLKTIAFEKDLSDRFGEVEVIEQTPEELQQKGRQSLDKVSASSLSELSAEAVKARWQKFQEQKQKKQEKIIKKKKVSKFKGIISSCFDMYMDLFVAKEEQNVQACLSKLLSDEKWQVDEDEANKVLGSSADFVYFLSSELKKCSKLTKNQSLFDIQNVFKKYLRDYSIALSKKIPSPDSKLSEKEEKTICLIINSAEYMSQVSSGLADAFKKVINPRFVDQISFSSEQNDFENVVHKGLKCLVSGFSLKMEPALVQMTKMPWNSWESVGDQSDYVNQISTCAQQSVSLYVKWLGNGVNFRYLLDAFSKEAFIPSLILHIYKCRKISEYGAQQLILDIAAIKSILLELPTFGSEDQNPSRQYVKIIQKGMAKAETLLKLIGSTPIELLVESYKSNITDGSESDFQKILELKGLSRSEQKSLMESFTQKTEKSIPTTPTSTAPTTVSQKGFKKLIADVMSKVENEKKEISEKLSTLKAPKFSMPDKDKK